MKYFTQHHILQLLFTFIISIMRDPLKGKWPMKKYKFLIAIEPRQIGSLKDLPHTFALVLARATFLSPIHHKCNPHVVQFTCVTQTQPCHHTQNLPTQTFNSCNFLRARSLSHVWPFANLILSNSFNLGLH